MSNCSVRAPHRLWLAVLSLMPALLLLPLPAARAGSYVWKTTDASGNSVYSPAYGGGTTAASSATNNDYHTGQPYFLDRRPSPPVYVGMDGLMCYPDAQNKARAASASGGDALSAKFTWQPAYVGEPPPACVLIQRNCSIQVRSTVYGDGSLTCQSTTGLGQSSSAVSGSIVDTSYTVAVPAADGSVSAPAFSPGVTMSSSSGTGGFVEATFTITYSATAYPLTISLPGTTPDSSGGLHILVGQRCSATLNGVPSGLTVTNIQWTASGKYVQPNSWSISTDNSVAIFAGLNSTYTYTQPSSSAPAPFWYWDDVADVQTVTCTATVTPPAGQGSPFTVIATKNVSLEVPAVQNIEYTGRIQINTRIPGTGGQLALGLGPSSGAGYNSHAGIWFNDSVRTPPAPYSAAGSWYHLQLVSVSRYRTPAMSTTAIGAQGNSVTGALDAAPNGSYMYGSQFTADGSLGSPTGPVYPDVDNPWTGPLSDSFGEYAIKKETFQNYIMYHAPGVSIDVPLAFYTWSWDADVKIGMSPLPVSWSLWNDRTTAGTITTSGAAQRTLLYPEWSSFGNISWQQ